jgi:hypothetical protein
MSDPAPPQRAFSPAHATRPAPAARATAVLAVVHAGSCAVAGLYGPTLNQAPPRVLAVLSLLVVLQGGAVVLYWQLGRWLVAARGYRGADPYLQLCAGLTLVDLVVRAGVMLSGGVFAIASVPVLGSVGVVLSYPHLQFFAFGTILIGLGYSLLRTPVRDELLRAYAITAVATGMCYAAFLANVAYLPQIAGDLLLARLFWSAADDTALHRPAWFPIAAGSAGQLSHSVAGRGRDAPVRRRTRG